MAKVLDILGATFKSPLQPTSIRGGRGGAGASADGEAATTSSGMPEPPDLSDLIGGMKIDGLSSIAETGRSYTTQGVGGSKKASSSTPEAEAPAATRTARRPARTAAEGAGKGGGAAAQDVDATGKTVIVSPTFKLIFLAVIGLTLFCGVAAIALAMLGDGAGANQQAVFNAMNSGWQLGLGAVFGLLGGKAT